MAIHIYTLVEAARQLRRSPRWLREWLRKHPVDTEGRPFYSPLSRGKTFDDDDLARIREAARQEERERLAGRSLAVVDRQPRAALAEALAALSNKRDASKGS